MGHREPVITPRSCPLCHGAEVACAPGVGLCGGTGVVDAATAARWRSMHPQHATSTTHKIESLIVRPLLAKLRAREPDDDVAAALAAEGQIILDEIERWAPVDAADTAGGPERLDSYIPVGPWQRRALEHLTKGPSR